MPVFITGAAAQPPQQTRSYYIQELQLRPPEASEAGALEGVRDVSEKGKFNTLWCSSSSAVNESDDWTGGCGVEMCIPRIKCCVGKE